VHRSNQGGKEVKNFQILDHITDGVMALEAMVAYRLGHLRLEVDQWPTLAVPSAQFMLERTIFLPPMALLQPAYAPLAIPAGLSGRHLLPRE
jgi:hypothetical protein